MYLSIFFVSLGLYKGILLLSHLYKNKNLRQRDAFLIKNIKLKGIDFICVKGQMVIRCRYEI